MRRLDFFRLSLGEGPPSALPGSPLSRAPRPGCPRGRPPPAPPGARRSVGENSRLSPSPVRRDRWKMKSSVGLQEMSSCTVPSMSPRGIMSTLAGLEHGGEGGAHPKLGLVFGKLPPVISAAILNRGTPKPTLAGGAGGVKGVDDLLRRASADMPHAVVRPPRWRAVSAGLSSSTRMVHEGGPGGNGVLGNVHHIQRELAAWPWVRPCTAPGWRPRRRGQGGRKPRR